METRRTISLQCPTCGGTEFEGVEDEAPEASVECTTCHRSTAREQLIDDNAEHIAIQQKEMLDSITKDVEKDLRDALRGNKYFKLR